MIITNLTASDEGEVTSLLNKILFKPMPLRRTEGWTAGKPVPVDGQMPVVAAQSGGIYRSLVSVRQLGNLVGAHHLATEDPAPELRAVMPVTAFEAEVPTYRHVRGRINVRPENGRIMFLGGHLLLRAGRAAARALLPNPREAGRRSLRLLQLGSVPAEPSRRAGIAATATGEAYARAQCAVWHGEGEAPGTQLGGVCRGEGWKLE